MHLRHLLRAFVLLAVTLVTVANAVDAPVQTGKGHRFACADYSQGMVFIVSAEGKAEWEYPAPSANDLWVLPNGNTVMSNWLGHNQFGKAPHVVEITADKKVVWTFADHATMKTVSSLQLLEVPGDVTRGEIPH